MKKYLFSIMVLVAMSCSKEEDQENPKVFRFLEFEKDVLLPNTSESELTFLALDFDNKIQEWEISLSNGTVNFPISINKIENTKYGLMNTTSFIQRIYLKMPKLDIGDYTLKIKYNKTSQIYSDIFLVRNEIFRKLKSSDYTTYNFIPDASVVVRDYLYFQNALNVIEKELNPNSVRQVFLENKTTLVSYSINCQISNGDVNFNIPLSIPIGSYFLSIKYNNGLTSYFEKDIVVLDQQLPTITKINKNLFSSGDEIIVDGTNFRYKIQPDILPSSGLLNIQTQTILVFKDINREFSFSYGGYAQFDPNYNDINADGTKLISKIDAFAKANIFTDANRTYFEGQVYLKSGPYQSNPVDVKIVY
jgi:hypothetical protein